MASAYSRAEPSMMGVSCASMSISALSTPEVQSADMMCSMVQTRWPPASMVVPREVSTTLSQLAGIMGCPSRSVRRNAMPYPASAGLTVMVTLTPV